MALRLIERDHWFGWCHRCSWATTTTTTTTTTVASTAGDDREQYDNSKIA